MLQLNILKEKEIKQMYNWWMNRVNNEPNIVLNTIVSLSLSLSSRYTKTMVVHEQDKLHQDIEQSKTQTTNTLLLPIIVNGILDILDVRLGNKYNTNSIKCNMHLYIYIYIYIYCIYYTTLKLIMILLLLLFYCHLSLSSFYSKYTNLNRVHMCIIFSYHHYCCCCEFPCCSLMLLPLLLLIWWLLLLFLNNCCCNILTLLCHCQRLFTTYWFHCYSLRIRSPHSKGELSRKMLASSTVLPCKNMGLNHLYNLKLLSTAHVSLSFFSFYLEGRGGGTSSPKNRA